MVLAFEGSPEGVICYGLVMEGVEEGLFLVHAVAEALRGLSSLGLVRVVRRLVSCMPCEDGQLGAEWCYKSGHVGVVSRDVDVKREGLMEVAIIR